MTGTNPVDEWFARNLRASCCLIFKVDAARPFCTSCRFVGAVERERRLLTEFKRASSGAVTDAASGSPGPSAD